MRPEKNRYLMPWGIVLCTFLLGTVAVAQTPGAGVPKTRSTAPKAGKKTNASAPTPQQAAAASASKKPPITLSDLRKFWEQGDDDLLSNELQRRGLMFEPEESFLTALANETKVPKPQMPKSTKFISGLVPPAPTMEDVVAQVPALLDKIKTAAQKKNETELEPLVHPELLIDKAKIYDLFDIANYRNHSLGRFSVMENRMVGVQFFQLTTTQVEKLYYLAFSMSRGHLVLRAVVTGAPVADLFLRDEQQLAKDKLNLVFRALNQGDDAALKTLCTPGLYESLKRLTDTSGSRLIRGRYVSLDTVSTPASASLDTKSARVVVRVGYPKPGGGKLDYYVDFERIDKDLKVVQVRDVNGGLIAWDPDIDNYLNDRYGIPRGSQMVNPQESDMVDFFPLSTLRGWIPAALRSRNSKKLEDIADQFLQSENSGAEGYGIRGAAEYISGNFDKASVDDARAVDQSGTAYFVVMKHNTGILSSQPFTPMVLSVSRTSIDLKPFPGQGGDAMSFPPSVIETVSIDKAKGGRFTKLLSSPSPYLKFELRQKESKLELAAFGTACDINLVPPAQRATSVPFNGGGCPSAASTSRVGINFPKTGASVPAQVPANWDQDLLMVADIIQQHAMAGAGAKK